MKGSILFVEDEEAILRNTRHYFERKGYLVIAYNNGKGVVDDLSNKLRYDIAVIDLSLPIIDGEQVITLCKKLHPEIPVISASGYEYKLGNSDRHMRKPFSLQALEAAVNELIGM